MICTSSQVFLFIAADRALFVLFQDAFEELFRDAQKEREQCLWNGLLYTTLGLGTLAAMLLVKG